MNQACLFLARIYLKNRKAEKNISTMVFLCFIGIFISTFALSLVMAIMSGFEKGTHEKLRSIHPHIIMQPFSGTVNFPRVHEVIKKEFPNITAAAPISHTQALLIRKPAQAAQNSSNTSQAVILKGIDPDCEQNLNTIYRKIVSKDQKPIDLSHLLQEDTIIIGKKLAEQFEIQPGSNLELWYTQDNQDFSKITVTVSGLFSTGIEEFDYNLAYCSLSLYATLFPHSGVSQIQIQIDENADEAHLITMLKSRFKMQVYSWKDLYPALVSALKLQKYAMFCVLALIALVASINMLALLSMYILKKKMDIAVLAMIGASRGTIKTLFICVGMVISFLACMSALLLSFFCEIFLLKFPFIQLPDSYYVTHLPVSIEFQNFFIVWCVTMGICMISCWYATSGSHVHTLAVLKGEE